MRKLLYSIMAMLLAIAVSAQETPAEKTADTAKAAPAITAATLEVELEIASGISERMPTGMAADFGADVGNVFAWCRVTGALDTTYIRHVYYYNGEEMAGVDLPVKSPSWRTWSSKEIMPQWLGDWEVKVFDVSGNLLASKAFKITAVTSKETAPQETGSEQSTGQ